MSRAEIFPDIANVRYTYSCGDWMAMYPVSNVTMRFHAPRPVDTAKIRAAEKAFLDYDAGEKANAEKE